MISGLIWAVQRPLDPDRHREAGEVVGAALPFGTGHDLGVGEHVDRGLHEVDLARSGHFQQRTRHLEIVGLGDAARDGEAAAEIAERRLGAGALAEIGDLPFAERADHRGKVDALDRAVAHGEAALALQRGLDSVRIAAGAAQVKGELGAAREHAELRRIAQQRLGLDAVERKLPVKAGTGLDGIEHEFAGSMAVVELHAAERRSQDAVAEAEAERGRPELKMRDARLAHIEIDVGIERGRRARRKPAGEAGAAQPHFGRGLPGLRIQALPVPARAPARRPSAF